MFITFHHFLSLSRAPFLLLTPLCVLVGILDASVLHNTETDGLMVSLVFLAATGAHIAVNVLNEIEDFESGLDQQTRRTPFSGGSGCLPAHPELLGPAKNLANITILVVILAGLYLAMWQSAWLILFGLAGLLLIATYTRYLNRRPLLCLMAPGLAFGPIMVMGSSLATSGELSTSSFWLSIPVMFAVNNLLLLNQFPDKETDSKFGRHHAVIAFGYRNAALLYIGLGMLSAIAGFIGVLVAKAPVLVLLPGVLLPGYILIGIFMQRFETLDKKTVIDLLAANVGLTLLTPASLAAALYFLA